MNHPANYENNEMSTQIPSEEGRGTFSFSTRINIPKSSLEIGYQDRILTLGSCFAENIGTKLQDAYFLSFINPFGVLYNPMSVGQGVRHLLSEQEFTAADLFQYGSLWNSFAHSSIFSATTPDETLQKINSRLVAARYFLSETSVMMITLGTAWIFENIETGKTVSNCHKLPADRFNRRRVSVDEIVTELSEIIEQLRHRNPKLQFIFTISPIRHWKDGAHENTLSKSTLHLAVDELDKKFSFVHYFPSYEIVMDELRDYRFYAVDMLHPSAQAIGYIWQRFSETYFSENTQKLKKELEQLRADLNHRPLHAYTAEYQKFIQNLENKKNGLILDYPFLNDRFE